jgi:DNA-3-methyladenine glycosylase II
MILACYTRPVMKVSEARASRAVPSAVKKARMPVALTDAALARGLRALVARDPDLARIIISLGAPPMWAREQGFPTLIHIILEQQVSLASARAAFDRLVAAAAPLTPRRFLEFDDTALKAIGFSRQKMAYGRHLAESIIAGRLNLDDFHRMPDDDIRAALLQLKGIGPWSADIYLLMALRRPDVWPSGDLALAVAVQRLKRLSARPSPETLDALGEAWRPWRAIAARVLWHFYLSGGRDERVPAAASGASVILISSVNSS